MRQFIGGSDDSPVSRAKICGVRSPKHSSTESKPDLEPSIENQGVQMWAGIRWQRSSMPRMISSKSRESSPRIGRPSERMLPIRSSAVWMCSTTSSEGAKMTLCTLRVGAVPLVDVADLAGQHKAHPPRQAAGVDLFDAAATSGFSRYRPSSAGSSLARISCSQPGCEMSPVPTRCTPLIWAQRARLSNVRSFDVARE